MKPYTLLVVDDDALVLQSIKLIVPEHWHVMTYRYPEKWPDQHYDAAFIDMHLTGNLTEAEGLGVVKKLRQRNPHLEIVAMSGDLDRELMEGSLANGASRYLSKPLTHDEVRLTLEKIESWLMLQEAAGRRRTFEQGWVGSSASSQQIKRQIAELRGEPGPILIEGESGTGKEVVASILNAQDNRQPWLQVNIASLPATLFESEMFGHVRGAFTSAQSNKIGLAEAANGGDLFLDEVEALDLALQPKLLRFLESGEVRRVGSNEIRTVKTRVICATNVPLVELVRKGVFRDDLLWRISGRKIMLPPLRERREDIEALALHFLGQQTVWKKQLGPDALDELRKHNWPGNVRELKRVCEQVALKAPLPVIRGSDVQAVLRSSAESSGTGPQRIPMVGGLEKMTTAYEARLIRQALDETQDVDMAAKILEISRSNLYKKIKELAIDWN
jgi:DNA-binding NtrC family response regulator